MTVPLRGSLRLRLIVGSALGVILAVLLAGSFIAHLYRVHTTARFQSELDHHLNELVAMTHIDGAGALHVAQSLSDPEFQVEASGLYWQMDSDTGPPLRSSSLGRNRLTAEPATGEWRIARVGREIVFQRSAQVTIDGHPVIATIASAREHLDRQVSEFRGDLVLSMIAVGLSLLAGAMALVRFGLAPVRRLSEEVDRLSRGEVQRLDPHVPVEFSPAVERLNALLDSQAQLIARARSQAGNLAHELRTPLALIIDEAEQLRLRGQVESADFLLTRGALMQHQIDHHLTRAAAAGTRGAGTQTEVAPLVAQIVEAMQRLHAGRNLAIDVQIPPDLRLPCERGDLAEIVSNLIDNACKWARRRVTVTAGTNVIEIHDDGVGIPADKRDMVMSIGVRLDPTVPGSGLGLPATADLLQLYEGRLILGQTGEGGLTARVTF